MLSSYLHASHRAAFIVRAAAWASSGLVIACGASPPVPTSPTTPTFATSASTAAASADSAANSVANSAAGSATGSATGSANSPGAASSPAIFGVPANATACGPLGCLQFSTAAEAFTYVLDRAKASLGNKGPAVLAIGESHAPKGREGIRSSAQHFAEDLLPLIAPETSDLLLELMLPPSGCEPQRQRVQRSHEPVQQQQSASAQSQYVAMGQAARELGVVADLLRPSCADLRRIAEADDAVEATLTTIARLTTEKVNRLLSPEGRPPRDRDKMIVLYGGVLHNDPDPVQAKRAWSFGADLKARLQSSYVPVDIFVPEFIGDSATWQALPWYPHYDKNRLGAKATVYHQPDGQIAIILPRQ